MNCENNTETHPESESCSCGCGGHHHDHAEGETCSCGCGGHHHDHAEGEACSCGCGGHHHHDHAQEDDFEEPVKEIENREATEEQRAFLKTFQEIAPLPIAKYVLKSSKEHSFESVALRDVCLRSAEDSIATIKETAAFLQALEASNLIAIDYDSPLSEEAYAHYYTSDSFLLFEDTVAQGQKQAAYLGDIATLEEGCIVMTAWGKEQANG